MELNVQNPKFTCLLFSIQTSLAMPKETSSSRSNCSSSSSPSKLLRAGGDVREDDRFWTSVSSLRRSNDSRSKTMTEETPHGDVGVGRDALMLVFFLKLMCLRLPMVDTQDGGDGCDVVVLLGIGVLDHRLVILAV